EVVVDGLLREEILEPEGRTLRVVAQPVHRSMRQDRQIAGAESSRLDLAVGLEPALARSHDVKRRAAVLPDAEAPGSAQLRSAEDRARDPEIAQQRVDRVGLGRVREAPSHDVGLACCKRCSRWRRNAAAVSFTSSFRWRAVAVAPSGRFRRCRARARGRCESPRRQWSRPLAWCNWASDGAGGSPATVALMIVGFTPMKLTRGGTTMAETKMMTTEQVVG